MSESFVSKAKRLVLEKQCADVGRQIARLLPAGVGFTLLVFDFGEKGDVAYVSNGRRADVLKLLKEHVAHMELEGVS